MRAAFALVCLAVAAGSLAACDRESGGAFSPTSSSPADPTGASQTVGETTTTGTPETIGAPGAESPTTTVPTTQSAPADITTSSAATGGIATTTTRPGAATRSLWERIQESGGAGLGDSLYPLLGNAGYDVVSYGIEMSFDPVTQVMSADSTITAVATADLDLFSLDFFGMQIHGVTVNGFSADFEQVSEELVIDPSQLLIKGDRLVVMVSYEGVVASRPHTSIPGFSAGGHRTPDGLTFFVLNEPDGSAAWAPFNDHPLDKASVTVEVEVPSGWTVVSGGRLVEEREGEETTAFRWSMEHPVAPYLIPLAIGPLISREEPDTLDLEITTWYPEGLDASLLDAFSRQDEMIRFFAERFGPYPFETFGALVVDIGVGLALEHQTLPTYDLSATAERVVVHELAHQWFGNSVSVADWSDIWLNESFATLAEWLWIEETAGVAEYDGTVADSYGLFSGEVFFGEGVSTDQATAAATNRFYPPGKPPADDLFNYTVYARGALTLVALRDRLGDEPFFDMTRTWHDKHRYGNATTAEFLSLVEETGGPKAKALTESWLYDPLPPAMPERDLYPLEYEESSHQTQSG